MPPNAYGRYGAPAQWPKPGIMKNRSPSKDRNKKDPIGFKPVEMGNPDHPNPHLRMSLPESYYARKMEEEKNAQQNLSRKLIANTLQEGIRQKFSDANDQQMQQQMMMGYGPMGQGGYNMGQGGYSTLQPMGQNPMSSSMPTPPGAPSKTMKPSAGPIAPMKPHKDQMWDAQDQL